MIHSNAFATAEAAERFVAKAARYVPLRGCLYVFGSGEQHFVMPRPEDDRLRRTPAGLELDLSGAPAELERQGRRVLVLSGTGGAGKTTFLQSFCAEAVRNVGQFEGRSVFYVERASVSDLAGLGDAPRDAYVLLDAFDWKSAGVEESIRALEAAADARPETRFIVASRASEEASERFSSAFLEVRVVGLNRQERKQLVERCCATLSGAQGAVYAEQVNERLREIVRRPDGAFLARNRLIVSGLCRTSHRDGALPRDAAKLLEAGTIRGGGGASARGELASRMAGLREEGSGGVTTPRHNGVVRSERGGIDLIPVLGGTFRMGSPDDEAGRWKDEGPVHEVRVPDFYLAPYAVTNRQYGAYLEAHPAAEPPPYWGDPSFGRPDQPVVGIGWEEARQFALWAGGRLPTEAEWEYACRAGTDTPRYGDIEQTCWYRGNSGAALHPVGQKEPNAWGVYDLLGNAWEWVEDDHHPTFEGAPDDGSAWCDQPRRLDRILRGGTWADAPHVLRAATRLKNHPGPRIANVGFRLARSVAS